MERKTTKERLEEMMGVLGIRQVDICEKTKISKADISQYVNGNRIPRQDKLAIISNAYGIDPAWLMGYDVPMFRKTHQQAESDAHLMRKISRLSDRDRAVIERMVDSMLQE